MLYNIIEYKLEGQKSKKFVLEKMQEEAMEMEEVMARHRMVFEK